MTRGDFASVIGDDRRKHPFSFFVSNNEWINRLILYSLYSPLEE